MAHHEQDASGQWWYVWDDRRGERVTQQRTRVEPKPCEGCGDLFLAKSRGDAKKRRFCSRQCSGAKIGRSFRATGERHPKWRGGRYKNASGYVRVWLPPDERPLWGGVASVLEHRLVMSQVLGRPLLRSEQVHHKNGIRHDNRPENLELWNRSHPDGVRAADLPHCPTCTCASH